MLFYRYNRIIFSWSQETNLDYKIKTWQRIKLKTVLTTTTTTKKFKRCIDFFCLLVYNILLFNFETNKKKSSFKANIVLFTFDSASFMY